MKKLLIVLIVVGILIGAGGCTQDEPVSVNDTPEWIAPDEHGWIWKIGYIPAKATHEFISGIWDGLWGEEPIYKIREEEK